MTEKRQAAFQAVVQAVVALKNLSRSPAFMREAYAKRYLGSAKLKCLSLLHYVAIGEARGHLPNPFFDPAFFQKQAGTCRLTDFLLDQRLWIFATSPHFDTAWYVARHADEMDTYENPLLHFLSTGFGKNFDPSPDFETTFFRKAAGRDERNKLRLAYEWLSDPVYALPVSMAALEARQKSFQQGIALNTLRLAPEARRRNLVFVQAGGTYEMAAPASGRSYDVMLNYYESRPILPDQAEYIFHQAGTKASAVFTLWSRHPDLFARYDAVLFLDDDVSITPAQIERLFALQVEQGADLLQASLTSNSACFFPVLKQPLAGPGMRPVTAVEIMMPVVSRRAMAQFGWVFGEAISGWGVDLLLSAKVRETFGDTIWLAGDVVCAHEREVDREHGNFYRFLRARGLDAGAEAGRIAMKYGVNDKISAINFLAHSANGAVPPGEQDLPMRDPFDDVIPQSAKPADVTPSRFKLSCILIVYNMHREAARTLATLSAAYQRDIDEDAYEVIVVDNSRKNRLEPDYVERHGRNFRLLHMPDPSVSPAPALNFAARHARGDILVSMIDGARMLSPGCLSWTLQAMRSVDRAMVTVPSWHLGPDVQNVSVKLGYNQAVEDALLETRDWRSDGYLLFDLCEQLDPSSAGAAWFAPVAESNYVAVARTIFDEVGGFDEKFTSVGGGAVNLDFFKRLIVDAGCNPVTLFGEGTFHQFHGGVSTNVPVEEHPWPAISAEYKAIRGCDYAHPLYTPIMFGQLREPARRMLTRAPNIFTYKYEPGWIKLFKATWVYMVRIGPRRFWTAMMRGRQARP